MPTTTRAKTPTPPRPPLSQERVFEAAIALADQYGLEALTMRRLAQELGVEAMSLYYYVAKKDDILAGIVDAIIREIELPSDDVDWKTAIRRCAISAHQALLSHPWAASLMFSTGPLPARLLYMEALLKGLHRAGLSEDATHRAYHALDSHIIGFTLWETSITLSVKDLPDLAASFLSELAIDEFPHLAKHIAQHITDADGEDDGTFEFGLDLILDGLDRLRKSKRKAK